MLLLLLMQVVEICKHTTVSSLHSNVAIPSDNNLKSKPEALFFYNETKAGLDILEQMSRCYSVKTGSKRWGQSIFFVM